MNKLDMSPDRLVELLNEQFGAPHLPGGFVEAEVTNDGICLQIGPRAVHFTVEGKVSSAVELEGCVLIEPSIGHGGEA